MTIHRGRGTTNPAHIRFWEDVMWETIFVVVGIASVAFLILGAVMSASGGLRNVDNERKIL